MKKFFRNDGVYFYKIFFSKIIRIMRNSLILLFLTTFQLLADNSYSQNTKLTLNLNDVSVEGVLNEIESQSEFYFLFNYKLVDVERHVDIQVENEPISNVLASLFEDQNIDYVVIDRQIILSPGEYLTRVKTKLQPRIITGTVTDDMGDPLIGVTVVVKGTTIGAITDINGNYEIDVPDDAKILVFSFVGMLTQEISIGNQTVISITMEAAYFDLEEVVSIGYMTQRKADLTGAVSIVPEEEVTKTQNSNLLQSLQGRIPGLNITTDGSPTGDVIVTLRGQSSMTAGNPLIVVDGLATDMNLRDINAQDIASLQVLKDASSASIYGARAANGVILIETLKGKSGETRVTYNGKFGISQHYKYPELLDTEGYGRMLFWCAVNDGEDPSTTQQLYNYTWHREAGGKPVLDNVQPIEWLTDGVQRAANTDWIKECTQLGLQQDHQITLQTGTENSRQMLSLNYFENQGTQKYTSMQRITMRLNSEYKMLNDRLTVGENFAIAKLKWPGQIENIVSRSVAVDKYTAAAVNEERNILVFPSIIPVYSEDGTMYGGPELNLAMDDFPNPLRRLASHKDDINNRLKVFGNIFASVNILEGLDIKTNIGINYTQDGFRHLEEAWHEAGGKGVDINGVGSLSANDIYVTWSNTVNYSLNLQKHRLDFVAGTETQNYLFEEVYGYREGLELESLDYAVLDAATGTMQLSGDADEWKLLSYFGKFNYVFSDKYLLSATIRRDGSSVFGENNRFGYFPAVSAGWRISEERFLSGIDVISNLKLRASWGMNGNSNIPTNAIVDVFDADYVTTAYPITGQNSGQLPSGYRIVHRGNPNLKWEATQQVDIGVDYGLLNHRISGSIDYFYKYTNGMLYEPAVLAVQGEGAQQWINAANMTNTGLEFLLNYMGNSGGDFKYSIQANMFYHMKKNVVDDLPESVIYSYGGNGLEDNILGRPLHSAYGFVADGLYKTEQEVLEGPEQAGKGVGRIRFKDLDGDGQITTEHDRTWIGETDPDLSYGLDFTAYYKNFDFSMFWQGVTGNTIRNGWLTLSDFANVLVQKDANHPKRILEAWNPWDNSDSDIPALTLVNSNDENRLSTYVMKSGSYLKLRNVEIGYTIPGNLLGKTRIHLALSAQNLINVYKWWGDDAWEIGDAETPYVGSYDVTYMRPRIFLLKINVSY